MSASTSAVLQPGALAGASRARRVVSRPPRRAGARVAPRRPPESSRGASSKADGESAGDDDDATEPEARGAAGDDAQDAPGVPKPPSWYAKISEAETSKDAKDARASPAASPSADVPDGAPEPSGLARLVPSPVRAWLAAIPAKRKAERLEGLLLAAEADRDSFVKQDAYMRELALEEMWDEVVARFESRTAASGPGSVVAYLRAMAATGRLEAMDGMDARVMPPAQLSMAAAGVMRDENVTGEQAVAAGDRGGGGGRRRAKRAARDADRPFEPRARRRGRAQTRAGQVAQRAAARRRRAGGGGATTRSETSPARPKAKARSGAAG
jgi:hypothetical protein